MSAKKTFQERIDKAIEVHGSKYDYSLAIGSKSYEKWDIKCFIHGIFTQTLNAHLQGYGCHKCGREKTIEYNKPNFELFFNKATKIHGNLYEYFPDKYINSYSETPIKCKKHNYIFFQVADTHMRGAGCKKCSRRRVDREDIINEFNIIHNFKYDYSLIKDEKIMEKAPIICKKHGSFMQTINNHIHGSGCPKCSSRISKQETKWLDSLGIPDDKEHRQKKINIGKSYIKPDGYMPNTNTIYEFYGDYWHGNINVLDSNIINYLNKKTIKELYIRTIERENLIKNAGYNLITIWESDWKKLVKNV